MRSDLGPPCLVYDESLRNDIISSTKQAFALHFNLTISARANFTPIDFHAEPMVINSIQMRQNHTGSSPTLDANMYIAIPDRTLNTILRDHFNGQQTNLSLNDVVGEMTNLIYGLVKQSLNARGYFFEMDLPQIAKNNGEVAQKLAGQSTLTHVPFESSAGIFHVLIAPENR